MNLQIRKIQVARRLVQLGIVFLLLLIPAVSRYSNYVAAREIDQYLKDWDGSLQGRSLAAIDTAVRMLPGAEVERVGEIVRDREGTLRYAQGLKGSVWSMNIGPLSMSDPLGAAESIVARRHVAAVVAISLVVPLVFTLLFGRIFCSWICPMGFFFELTDKFRKALKFLEIPPRNVLFTRRAKFVLLAAGLGLTAITAMPILGYVYPPAIVSRESHDFVFTMFDRAENGIRGFSAAGLTWMSLVLVGIAAFEVLVSRRWWCRYICPGGGLYILLGAFRPVRVKLIESKCTRCTDCVVVCPMGLNPMNNKMGAECDNCGECISHCDDKALAYGFAFSLAEPVHPPLGTRVGTAK